MRAAVAVEAQEFYDLVAQWFCDRTEDLEQTVQSAPDDEAPFCSVPQAADKENDQYVKVFSDCSFSAAAEGDIQIIAEPGAERDVPSVPEFGNAHGHVGRVEVFHQADAENF